jgi:WD40 repeat protein
MKAQNKWFRLLTLAIFTGLVSPSVSYGMEATGNDELTAYFKELSKKGILPKELQQDIRRLQLLKDVVLIGLLKPVLEEQTNHFLIQVALVSNKLAVVEEKVVEIWDLASDELRKLEGHTDNVRSIAAAGDKVVTGSYKTARIWDINTGQQLHILKHKGFVTAVAITGDKVVTGSREETAKIWNINTGQLLRTIKDTVEVNSIAAADDKLVIGSQDGTVTVWNINTGQHLHTLFKHDYPIGAVAITGNKVIAGVGDSAHVWNINTGQYLFSLKGPIKDLFAPTIISSIAAAGDKVVTAASSIAIVWDVNTGKLLYTMDTGSVIYSVAMSSYITSSGKRIDMVLTGSYGGMAKLWILPPDLRGLSMSWIVEKATVRQLDFIKRAYDATIAGEEFIINFPSEDAIVFLSFPKHIQEYLVDRLNIRR